METLQQIRQRLGINQNEVARRLSITVPQLSNYETNTITPNLEDMINAEILFQAPLKWQPTMSEDSERNILNAINTLSRYYPLSTVLAFVQRLARQDAKAGCAERTIMQFADAANRLRVMANIPPTFEERKES